MVACRIDGIERAGNSPQNPGTGRPKASLDRASYVNRHTSFGDPEKNGSPAVPTRGPYSVNARRIVQLCFSSSPSFLKSKAAEFMQYRRWVGAGPSSNTWPRCASHFWHNTSVRFMPNAPSVSVWTFSSAIGAQKLGQPVPDSNLVSELNNALPQHAQR